MHNNTSIQFARIHHRIFAYLIDSLVVFLVFVVITQTFLFVPIRETINGSEQWFRSGWSAEIYTLLTISLPTWLYFGLCEISSWRATVGKRLLKLQTLDIASKDRITPTQTIIRTLIKMLPWELAHLTNNLPMPIWYDPDPGFRFGFVLVPLLTIIYSVFVLVTRKNQSLHDLAAKTIVVRQV